jgi:hypothetical protein
METIKNMSTNTNRSDKSKQILDNLALEDISDYDQLMSDVNDELAKGYELLNKLNINRSEKTDSSSDTETDSDQIINKVSKAKITRSKQN